MRLLAYALALPLLVYARLVSPLIPNRCRFAPTCSRYAVQALHDHGAARGSWLAVRRVARCHPFDPGGHDPVPPARSRVGDHAGTSPSVPPAPAPLSGAPS